MNFNISIRASIIVLTLYINILSAQQLEKISLQLQWFDQFQFAGYYIAKEKGFYKEEGLNVELKKYTYGMNPINKVLNKQATYGVGHSSLIENNDVVLLHAIFQNSPLIMLTTKNNDISNIQDFRRKKISLTEKKIKSASLLAMLSSNNINTKDLILKQSSKRIEDLINGKANIITAYLSNEPYILRTKGFEPIIFNPSNYGFDFYDDILFTSKDEAINHRERVIKFSNASLKGWRYAFDNIEETVNLILKKYNSLHKSKEALLFEARELKKLAYKNNIPLGSITLEKIQQIYHTYNILGLYNKSINYHDLIFNFEMKVNYTQEEIEYLNKKKVITMCVDANSIPLEYIENNQHKGIIADIFLLIQNQLPIEIKPILSTSYENLKKKVSLGKCDIKSITAKEFNTFEHVTTSNSYISDNFVVITHTHTPFINELKNYAKKSFLVKYQSYKEYLNKHSPYLKHVEVIPNTEKALELVKNNQAYGYIDISLAASYIVSKYGFDTFKVNTKIEKNIFGSIGIRKDEEQLNKIFNKIIANIPKQKIENIKHKFRLKVSNVPYDYTPLVYLTLFFVILTSIVLYFLIKQNKLKQEIEEQKNTFEKLYLKSSDGVLLLEKNKFVDCNDAAVAMLEYTTKNELLNLHPSMLSPIHQANQVNSFIKYEALIEEAIKNGFTRFEWVHLTANNKQLWVETVLTDIELGHKKIIHVVWRDISHRKFLEKKAKKLEIQSKKAALGRLVSMIGHQWRQPLSLINAITSEIYYDIINNNYNRKKLENDIEEIENITLSLSSTISNIHRFYNQEICADKRNMKSIFEECINILFPKIATSMKPQITINNIDELTLEREIIGLEESIITILSNSLDIFKERNTNDPKIIINFYRKNSFNYISIEDNGGGFIDVDINKIFDIYSSKKNISNHIVRGYGLYIAKDIIENNLNGTIKALNTKIGAKFIIKYKDNEKI